MIRLINRVQQTATYKSGSPNYIDLTGSATAGMATVASRASSDGWSDGDIVGVLVVKDDSHLEVWTASWNATSSTLEQIEVEDSIGSLSDDDAVMISGTLTRATLEAWRAENQREVLTAARTFYVATTGSDSNDGLTAGAPFLTIQKAVDTVCSLDLSIYQVTIQLADGTYTDAAVLNAYVGALSPIIQGNSSTPGNVVVHRTGGAAISNSSGRLWTIKDFEIRTTTSGAGLIVSNASSVDFSGIRFGACATAQIQISTKSSVTAAGNYSIVGNPQYHVYAAIDATFVCYNRTVTLTGTPAFSIAFAYATLVSSLYFVSSVFSGSATGKRYDLSLNSACYVASAGTTFLPGDAVGSTATGGQYA